MTTPPIPTQRGKVKLLTTLKAAQSEQSTKLQSKVQLEYDLLEDIKNYTKLRAAAEKDYAQALLKISSQLLAKFQTKDISKTEEIRTPYGLWRKILEETEATANARMKVSQVLQCDVSENIKTLKTERVALVKQCCLLSDKLHEEMTVTATELSKAQKSYNDFQKLTNQANEHATDVEEKLKKGTTGLFSSRAKLEKNLTKATERQEVSEKRSTTARNDYLLHLAALNAHQRKYYESDLPDLIATQDGSIYEQIRNYYLTITSTETQALQTSIDRLHLLDEDITQLERAYAVQLFLKENPVFTKCIPHEFIPSSNDKVNSISKAFGSELQLNKEARKWTTRLTKERKLIRKKLKELTRLKANPASQETNTFKSSDNLSETNKVPEVTVESLSEEIRHLEIVITKTTGRVEALRNAGVNVDEWLREESVTDDDDNDFTTDDHNENAADDDFAEDEWDEPTQSYSDDALSTTSSQDTRCLTTPAVVLYAYQATSQEELSIYDGEELEVIESEGDGWCKTRNKNGQIGFVPESYIELKPRRAATISSDGDPISRASSFSGSIYQDVAESSQSNHTPVTSEPAPPFICYAKASYDYEACEDEELTFVEGDIIWVTSQIVDDDDGWWEGILNGKRGVFPSIVVEELKTADDTNLLQSPDNRPRLNTDSHGATFPRSNNDSRRIRSLEFESSFT